MESRLAALTLDTDDLKKISERSNRPDLPEAFQPSQIAQMMTTVPALFNMLNTRRAIIPAANGHCSARALARYYAALADNGLVPPPQSSSSKPPLGSHTHTPKFAPPKPSKKHKASKSKDQAVPLDAKPNGNGTNSNNDSENSPNHFRNPSADIHARLVGDPSSSNVTETSTNSQHGSKIFTNPMIHDAFMGVGEYEGFAKPDGGFGLGFKRYYAKDRSLIGFGHSGMGGSTGFCDIKNRFAIAVTLNKMSFGGVTASVVKLVCSELNIPLPEDYAKLLDIGSDGQINLGTTPMIN